MAPDDFTKRRLGMISVIIPTCNRYNCLLKAIRSVLKQTYKNIEIIIVDDNSEKNIAEYIKFHIPKNNQLEKIKFIKNDFNLGAAASRNLGVKYALGKYIALLDSDDYWCCTKLEKQIAKFQQDVNLDLVYCDQFFVIDETIKRSNKRLIKKDLWYNLVNGWTAPNTSTLMFKKESYFKTGGFDENLESCQDHDLWFKISINEFNVDYVREPLSFFVLDSAERISFNTEKRMNGVTSFLRNVKKYIPAEKYSDFRSRYICDASLPILKKSVREKNIYAGLKIYYRYLMTNKFFYKRALKKIVL